MILLTLLIAAALAAPLTADQAVAAALSRDPTLAEAAAARVAAEGQHKASRGLRHDPTVGAELAVVGQAWGVSLAQPLSISGEGLAASAAARHAQAATEARHDRAALEVAADTRRAWIQAVVARAQAELAARALAVARRIEAAASQRVAVGEASQLDLRLARLQLEKARTAWMAATVADGEATAGLAATIGVQAGALELPTDPLAGAPQPAGDGAAPRSGLRAADAEVEAAQAALRRERAAALPPLSLGAFVEQEGDELRAGPSLSLTVPLWQANVDGRSRARAELSAAQARRDAAHRHAAAEQTTAARVTATLETAAAAQGDDLPAEAEAALDSVALGYDRGELDLLSTALLQGEIIEGQAAWLEGRRLVAEARLTHLLAIEDPRLLGPAGVQ